MKFDDDFPYVQFDYWSIGASFFIEVQSNFFKRDDDMTVLAWLLMCLNNEIEKRKKIYFWEPTQA